MYLSNRKTSTVIRVIAVVVMMLTVISVGAEEQTEQGITGTWYKLDFNGDGKDDVYCITKEGLYVAVGYGTGRYGPITKWLDFPRTQGSLKANFFEYISKRQIGGDYSPYIEEYTIRVTFGNGASTTYYYKIAD